MDKPLLDYSELRIGKYKDLLLSIGAISRLYSENSAPFLHYRITENIYCRVFDAINISRNDVSADALYKFKKGVGIKTFLWKSGGSFQKIAEFNEQSNLYRNLNGIDLVKKISKLRNERLSFTIRKYGLDTMIYHCIVRHPNGQIKVFEEPMHFIDFESLLIIESNDTKIVFKDKFETYEFYFSKSTLFKYFQDRDGFINIAVNIISDPWELLPKILNVTTQREINYRPKLLIPLYKESKSGVRSIPQFSGLNQWHGNGRKRDINEAYIPFPKQLRDSNPYFFPPRYTEWLLHLPNGKIIKMAICQDCGKSIMSNPNKALGEWLLRDALQVKEGTLLTYEHLLEINADSILFEKLADLEYRCDIVNKDDYENGEE